MNAIVGTAGPGEGEKGGHVVGMLQSSLCPIHSFYDGAGQDCQHPCGILIETINVCCLALFTTPYLARISWSPQAAC